MKLESAVIITKGLCFTVMGGLTPLATGLTQWVDSGEWPPTINWVVILAGCAVGAATQMLAFLSQSFGDYKAQMKYDSGGGQTVQPPPSTVAPPPQPGQPVAETKV